MIFLNGSILSTGEVASGRVCACSLRSRFDFEDWVLVIIATKYLLSTVHKYLSDKRKKKKTILFWSINCNKCPFPPGWKIESAFFSYQYAYSIEAQWIVGLLQCKIFFKSPTFYLKLKRLQVFFLSGPKRPRGHFGCLYWPQRAL